VRQHLVATKGDRLWQGIPTIELSHNGRLWAAFFSGGPREPDPENLILLTTSPDDGVTWSPPETLVQPPGPTRAYDPCLWHDPQGRLWLFYNLANLEERAFTLLARVAPDSSTLPLCWSQPRLIPVDAPFAFRLNKPTVLHNGDWLLPVTHAPVAPEGWFARNEQQQGVALSSDLGVNWSFHGAVAAPPWALENMLVERRDGAVWMLIRTGAGVVWQSTSHDGGRTWDAPTPTNIVNPGARFFVRRLASGRLLLINTPHPSQRQSLWACLSQPDDETRFAGGLLLDPRDRVSYPDAVQAPDGRVYAVHDCDRYGSGEIVLSVFDEREIEAGLATHEPPCPCA
jgi:predicted neuraminidase